MNDIFSEFTILLPALMGIALFFRPYHPRTLVLGILLLLISFAHAFIYLVYTGIIFKVPHLFPFHQPVIVLIGPVIYYYILFITNEREKFLKKDALHIILPVAYLLVYLPFYFSDVSYKTEYLHEIIEQGKHSHVRYMAIMGLLFIVFYIIISGLKIARRALHSNQIFWKILAFLIISWLFAVLSAIIGVMSMNIIIIRYNSYILGVIIILLYVVSQRYPYLMLFGTLSEKKGTERGDQKNRRAQSYLGSMEIEPVKKRLLILMEQEKFYRDENLSLKSLSEALEITPHQLSELLNNVFNKNFNQYINGFRIREAQNLLLENLHRNTLSIAYDTGFNSYSVFHSAFKNETGMTPGEYRKHQKPAIDQKA